jgi:cytochrome d ubiquinol oxidase subunit II
MGVTTVLLFAMHGAIYLVLKTEGPLQSTLRSWVPRLIGAFFALYFYFSVLSFVEVPRIGNLVHERAYVFLVAIAGMLIILNIPREFQRGRDFGAFLSSSLGIVLMMATFGLTSFPFIVYSDPAPNSLTVYNAASSLKTLRIALLMAAIGLPLVLSYTIAVYVIFRGKTRLGPHSY